MSHEHVRSILRSFVRYMYNEYLEKTEYVDYDHPAVESQACDGVTFIYYEFPVACESGRIKTITEVRRRIKSWNSPE